ncbi:hypothetical protein M5D96_002151, partial [Drosophila gunungcola]
CATIELLSAWPSDRVACENYNFLTSFSTRAADPSKKYYVRKNTENQHSNVVNNLQRFFMLLRYRNQPRVETFKWKKPATRKPPTAKAAKAGNIAKMLKQKAGKNLYV